MLQVDLAREDLAEDLLPRTRKRGSPAQELVDCESGKKCIYATLLVSCSLAPSGDAAGTPGLLKEPSKRTRYTALGRARPPETPVSAFGMATVARPQASTGIVEAVRPRCLTNNS